MTCDVVIISLRFRRARWLVRQGWDGVDSTG